MTTGHPSLVLDFDAAVLPVAENEIRLPLGDWQEAVRFGASNADYARLENALGDLMPKNYGCVFTGSGDFHHISLLLLRRLAARHCPANKTFDLVICDNHPDNMRYVFGLHCGSWVRRAAELAAVRHIHVVGICSADIGASRAWENYLGPFIKKKLTYWSIGVNADWLKFLNRSQCAKNFATAKDLLNDFLPVLRKAANVYLSIDKDVLDPNCVQTNWDQGVFTVPDLEKIITACAGKLCGADVCGDVSAYAYKNGLKRFLARLDAGQNQAENRTRLNVSEAAASSNALSEIQTAQLEHQLLNQRLASLLRPSAIIQ